MAKQRKIPFGEKFRGKGYPVDNDRDIVETNYFPFKYKRVSQNLEEITGMSRVEMPKHSMAIYTSSAVTFNVGYRVDLQHINQRLKVKMQTPDVRISNSFVQSSVSDERGYIGKVIFLE